MAEQGAKTAVPRLRFPEFRASAGWNQSQLGHQGVFLRGLTYASGDAQERGLLVLRSTNIQDGTLVLDKDLVFVGKSCSPDLCLQVGDIVICMSNGSRALVGKSAEYKGNYSGAITVGAFCSIYRPSLPFAKLAFQTERYADFVALAIGGGNINNLKNSDLEFFEFSIPPSADEQQKIADCLTSLDEVIATQRRKVEALKTHKRGLMQQLFPREGETRPRLRFPEFRDAPEWKDVAISDLGEVVTGSTPATSQPDYYGGDRPFVSPADISDLRFVDATKTTLSEDGFTKVRPIRALSVLFVCIGSTIGKVAQNIHECATNQQINAVVAKPGFCSDFIYYLLSMESARIAKLAGKQAVPIINKSQFSAVRIMLPKFDEQQCIADCLSSLDTKIAAETRQFAALKTHKQGLMQQLFPTSETIPELKA